MTTPDQNSNFYAVYKLHCLNKHGSMIYLTPLRSFKTGFQNALDMVGLGAFSVHSRNPKVQGKPKEHGAENKPVTGALTHSM